MKIDLRAFEAMLAVIRLALDLAYVEPVLQKLDEGQEEGPVEPVLVKIVRHPVRGGDDRHPPVEEHLEEAAHDHRIGDVGDLHLVERQKPQILGDLLGHGPDRIVDAGLARLMQSRLHFLHEGVEMDAALGLYRDIGVEEVHQHRLAAPDPAPEV